jgi:hypothetical protein
MRHAVVVFIVERLWPLMLAVYSTLAAISLAKGSDAFQLYTFDGHAFSITVFTFAAALAVPTMILPEVRPYRWIFFVTMGFGLTGRILQVPDDAVTLQGIARGVFVVAALLAHLVIQVDWMIEREHDDR